MTNLTPSKEQVEIVSLKDKTTKKVKKYFLLGILSGAILTIVLAGATSFFATKLLNSEALAFAQSKPEVVVFCKESYNKQISNAVLEWEKNLSRSYLTK